MGLWQEGGFVGGCAEISPSRRGGCFRRPNHQVTTTQRYVCHISFSQRNQLALKMGELDAIARSWNTQPPSCSPRAACRWGRGRKAQIRSSAPFSSFRWFGILPPSKMRGVFLQETAPWDSGSVDTLRERPSWQEGEYLQMMSVYFGCTVCTNNWFRKRNF